MKTIDLKAFRKSINFTQDELGEYLGCKKAFISAIETGSRPIPDEMYSKLIDNPYGWDVSMLLIHDKKQNDVLQAELDRYKKENKELQVKVEYHQMAAQFFESRLKELDAREDKTRTALAEAQQEIAVLRYRIEMLLRGGLKEHSSETENSTSADTI